MRTVSASLWGVASALLTVGIATSSLIALPDTQSRDNTAAFMPGVSELVVDLDDRLSDEQVHQFARRHGVTLQALSGYVHHDRIYRAKLGRAATGRLAGSLTALLRELRQDSRVEAADWPLIYQIPETAPTSLTRPSDEALQVPSGRLSTQDSDNGKRFVPNDPRYKYQWHLDQIRMPQAWTKNRGEGVIVAVVDTGVTPVEDLQGTELVPGWNFVDNNPNTDDDHGHGTHVAGTIAQTTHNGVGVAGVAYKAKIMPIKVLSGSGSGSVGGIAEGIRWAADHGANVINMSLGGPFNSPVLAKAVRYAHEHGVVVVCAAGNDGRGRVSYPAANVGSIAVAATQFDESTTFYSNWGKEITIAAPGGNTRVDQNEDGVPDGVLQNTVTPGNTAKQDYLLFMGTSMASPHVAGVAALLVSEGIRQPAQVAEILQKTSRRPSQYRGKHDTHYGAGIIDANAAIVEARQQLHAAQKSNDAKGSPWLGLFALGLVAAAVIYRRSRNAMAIAAMDNDSAGS